MAAHAPINLLRHGIFAHNNAASLLVQFAASGGGIDDLPRFLSFSTSSSERLICSLPYE